MTLKTKAILLTLLFGLPTIPLGRVIWPPVMQPLPTQTPYFIGLSIFEALGFGAGIAFLILAWDRVNKTKEKLRKKALAIYLSIGWLLISWWPHAHFHSTIVPNDYWSLLVAEYAFHVVSIIAASVAAFCIFDLLWSASESK